MKDFYYILGLQPNCGSDDIKEAYRKLSKKLHPDLNQGDEYFENRFKDINEAFETLRDPAKRSRYDEQLKSAQPNQPQSGPRRRTEQAPPSAFTKYKRRGPGLGMIVVLILLALIIGDYLVRNYSKSKKSIAPQTAAVVTIPPPAKVYHHHKRKRGLKNKIADDSATRNFDVAENQKPIPKPVLNSIKSRAAEDSAKPKPQVAAITPKPFVNPVPVASVNNPEPSGNGNFLYATSVKANSTGIINMRRHADFSSAVIGTIPANAKVFVLERGGDYYRIAFNSNIGYVPKWALNAQ